MRPKLVAPSEATQRMSALLARELLQWPEVSSRPMFGLRAFYRGKIIFAMLPDKKALEKPNAIGYKLASPKLTERPAKGQSEKWRLLELEDHQGIAEALPRLQEAYTRAAGC